MCNRLSRRILPTVILSTLCLVFAGSIFSASAAEKNRGDDTPPASDPAPVVTVTPAPAIPPVPTSTEPTPASEPPVQTTDTPPEDSQKDPRPTKPEIEEKIKTVQNSQEFDEATKAELAKRYKAALDWIVASEEALKRTAQYKAEIDGVAEAVAKVKAQLATSSSESTTPTGETPLAEMEQKLSQAESQLRETTVELTKREEDLKRRNERKTELTKLIDEACQRLETAKKPLASSPGNEETVELTSARRIEMAAHLAALENQLQRYQTESQRHDVLVELLPLQRDLALREKNLREKQLTALQNVVATKRKAESERQAREASEAQQALADSHPTLRDLAKRNADLAKKHETLTDQIIQTTNEVTETSKTLSQLEQDFENTKEKVRYAGNASSIGPELRKKRSELPNKSKCEHRIRFVNQEMPKEYLARMELQEERATLGDIETFSEEVIAGLGQPFAETSKSQPLQETVRELLEKKRELLDSLINDYDLYLSNLTELEIDNRKLIAETKEVTDYVNERVLWVRSADMLGPRSVTELFAGLLHLAQPKLWLELSKQAGREAIRQPGVIVCIFASLGILLSVQTRLRSRMKEVCVTASGSSTLKIWPTFEGIFLTAAMTATLPLFLALTGWWISFTDTPSNMGQALGWGLRYTAFLLWITKFTRRLCLRGHLAESHFGWSTYSLSIMRRHLRWLSYFGLPFVFLAVFAYHYHDSMWDNSLGRVSFVVVMLLLAAFMHAAFFAKNNVLREILAREPDLWLARFRFTFYILAIGLPLSLAILAWIGYYYSAQQLALRLEGTIALIFSLILLHAIVSRWFLVKRRNLSIAQMKERQAREMENAQSNVPVMVPVASTQRDLSVIHQQLNYLLKYAIVVSFLVGSLMIWADVLPALKVLDKPTLWHSTIEVVEVHENAGGDLIRQKVPMEVPTTARDVLMAILILIASFVIGRHLPALLEITLLSRMHFDKGGRHAISILLRYSVALFGLITAFHTVHINWGSVQWLAAGITVGLGFGLQEIFANFVSGLILLFERPIRVGDIITLGDTTGTVTDIRIRTTTVTNWDRKELIVPNKELITGRLLNWTLSDPVNRIVVNVGVAYKSDTRKVHDLILAIATNHPNIMENPEPRVAFESFGDSALNFVLRCYIASMDIRLDTINDLHQSIYDCFNAEGIEIAFPQMDIHVRTMAS